MGPKTGDWEGEPRLSNDSRPPGRRRAGTRDEECIRETRREMGQWNMRVKDGIHDPPADDVRDEAMKTRMDATGRH